VDFKNPEDPEYDLALYSLNTTITTRILGINTEHTVTIAGQEYSIYIPCFNRSTN
jgi:hypothetical protein